MAWCIQGLSITPRYAPTVVWDDMPRDFPREWDLWGRCERIPPEIAPTSATVTSVHKTLPDFLPIMTLWAVCEEFKTMVEALEPGVHQFFPLDIYRKSGLRMDRQYYLLNVCQKLDALIIEKSNVYWNQRDTVQPDGTVVKESTFVSEGRGELRLVLDKNLTSDRHLWRNAVHFPHFVFLSDETVGAVQRAKLTKLRSYYCAEV